MLIQNEVDEKRKPQQAQETHELMELPKVELLSIEEGERVSCKQASLSAAKHRFHCQCS